MVSPTLYTDLLYTQQQQLPQQQQERLHSFPPQKRRSTVLTLPVMVDDAI